MKQRSLDVLASYITIAFFALLIYLGMFIEVEGFNNVGITALWILGVLLIIGISENKGKKSIDIIGKYDKFLRRTILILLTLTIIYQGHIVLGLVYLFFIAAKINGGSNHEKTI